MPTPFYRRWPLSLRKRVAQLTWRGGFKILRHDGALFLLNYRNFVDRRIALAGGHERRQLAFLLDAMRDRGCDTFLDVGANFGLYSVLVAVKTECPEIVAFEPDQRSHDQFRGNLYLNGLSGAVTIHPRALSKENGRLPFFFAPETSTGQSRVAGPAEAVSVDAVRLDDFLAIRGKRLFIKIDVENHELEVIEGMARTLRDNRCFLQIECFGPHLARLTETMLAAGYRHIHAIDDDQYFAN